MPRGPWFHGVRARLVGIALVIALPLTALLAWNQYTAMQEAGERTQAEVNKRAEVAAVMLARDLHIAKSLVYALQDNRRLDPSKPEDCEQYLRNLIAPYSKLVGTSFLINRQGRAVCALSPEAVGLDLSDRRYFQRALGEDQVVVEAPLVSRFTRQWIWPVAVAVRDKDGHKVGVVTMAVKIARFADQATAAWVGLPGAQLKLSDAQGRELFVWGQHQVREPAAGAAGERVGWRIDPQDAIVATVPVEDFEGSLTVAVPRDEVLAQQTRAERRALWTIVLVSVAALALAWWYGRSTLVNPLRQLQRTARRVARGELSARVGNVSRITELRNLSQAFDAMADSLQSQVSTLQAADARVRQQLEHMSLLDQTTRAIGDSLDLQGIFETGVSTLIKRLPVDFACVALRDSSQTELVVCSASGGGDLAACLLEARHIEVTQNGLVACLQGRLVYEPDTRALDYDFPKRFAARGLRSLVLVPLRTQSLVVGVLAVARSAEGAFSSVDCEFLRQFGENVAIAVGQVRLHTALQAAYDDLKTSQQVLMHEERLRVFGQMSSGIAHDINNALSPVSLYADSLLETEPGLSERTRAGLQRILRALDDVAQTLGRLRDFYRRSDSGPARARVDLPALCDEVIDLCRVRWHDIPLQRGVVIRIERDYAVECPPVPGVHAELRDSLVNLIINAVDAMPDGGVIVVRTALRAQDPGSPQAVLEVKDTGVGMDERTRERCLEPFFTTKGERGTGLGLPMVFGTAQRHGGSVEVDSTPGQGTAIRLLLPAHPVPMLEAESGIAPAARPRPMRLLVVDDDPIALRSLADALVADGHSVTSAESGAAGIRLFESALHAGQGFDAVFTDLGMPQTDGLAVAAALKRSSAQTPVILLTGWGQRLESEGPPRGIDRVILKPPRIGALREALTMVSAAGPA